MPTEESKRAPAVPGQPLTDPAATTGGGSTLPAAAPPSGGRYVLGAEIGQGGMGVIYRATDPAFGREVAVKVLHEKHAPDSGVARRFAEEARITGQLQHPAIPPVHDLGTLPDGRPFLAMKLIRGHTLAQMLAERPDPSAERGRFLAVFEQVCHALAYAHSHDVIHRDLKPGNVMVGNFGEVQVMDWGLAKVLSASQKAGADPEQTTGTQIQSLRDSDGAFTQAGSVLGTPAFMPPEQAAGALDKVDARSDVFGLGAILAVILTGKPPFSSGSSETVRLASAQGRVQECFARLDASGADPELVALCKRCLSPHPPDRPGDAGEVARSVAALRAAAEERARQAELQRARAEAEAREQRKRRRVQLALFAAVLALLLGSGAFAWWQSQRLGRNAEAVSALLDQAEEALRRGDAVRAEIALGAARKRAAEGGAGGLAVRLGRLGEDLELIRELDAIDRFRWTPKDDHKYPDAKETAASYRAALAAYGADPDEVGPEAAAARAKGSAVRGRLLEVLDRLLAVERSPGVRDALRAADPDTFREAVRDAVMAEDAVQLAALAERLEAEQPAGFVAVLGENKALPDVARRRLLGAAAATRSGSVGLLMALGMTYRFNQKEGAEERARWFQAATAAAPENPATHNNLGGALYDKKDQEGAVACWKESLRLEPKHAKAHYNLGLALRAKGDLGGAIASYKEAIRLDPKLAPAHRNLGNALYDKKDLDGAITSYKESLRLDPKDAKAHNTLGLALTDKKDLDGAIASFEEAIRLDPKEAQAHHNLGLALRAKGDLDGAVASHKEAIRLEPKDAKAQTGLGLALRAKGDLDGAIASYKEAICLEPKYAPAHYNLGNALYDKKDLDGAIASYKEAIRLEPKFAPAHHNLGNALRAKGDLGGAIASYKEAIRLDPKLAPAHHNLGNALYDKKDLDGAVASFEEAIRLEPKFAPAHVDLGLALCDKGDLDKAVASVEQALRIDPKNAFALFHLPRVKRMRDLLARLPDVLAGKAEPKTPTEAAAFAYLCALPFQKRFAAAVRLLERAFASDSTLAASLRYNAACFAARAAGGDGADAPADPSDRAALRGKALDWLSADLAPRKKLAASAVDAQRKAAAATLSRWLADSDLSGIREPKALEKLPDIERRKWRLFWAEVKDALAEAQQPPPNLLPPPLEERQ